MIVSQERFASLLNNLKNRIAKMFPISGERNAISISNLRWANTGADVYGDPELHKKYKTSGRTLASRLLGDVVITDTKTNKVLDRQLGHPILSVPHLTSKQSFIVGGKEVQIVNQIRLKPGTYTRYTADNNVETFINTAGGGYRIQFDRVRQIFRIRVGQSTYVYLYPVLKALGVNDVDLRKIWGDEILQENRKYDRPAELAKLYKKMRPYAEDPRTEEDLAEAILSFFASKPLDPNITKLTLGAKYTRIEPKVLVASSEKALRLARGEVKADDTENLAYKSLHSVDDFVFEKLEQNVPMAERAVKYQIDRRPSVVDVLPPSLFTKPVQRFFTTSEFSRYSDQNNPIDMVGVQSLVTSMGEGGISSVHAVSDRLRALHPSHLGIFDPVQTPESGKIGINAHLTLGSKKIGNEIGLTVINARTGGRETKKAFDLEDKVLAFYDEFDHTKTPPRAKRPQVKARFKGELKMIPAKQVDYIVDSPSKLFSFAANAVPFVHTNSPNRILMASHHISQAVPLAEPDVPLVQSKFGARGYETAVGERIVPQAPVDGTVKRVTAKKITIQGSDGQTYSVPLHDHYPLNSNAFLNEKAIVTAGQKVKKGQPVADSDFTRGGALAIGKSLRTGFMPYKGYNFEDGIVVSESAAKKLTSVHKHELSLNLDATISVGLPVFLAHFPAEAEGVDRSKYGPNGVVKSGAVLQMGDVAIPAVRKIKVHEEFSYASLHRSLRHQWQDVSVRWDSEYPAEVMNVVKTRKFITVYVKTSEALEVGDKLSQRHGGKGIVTMILPDKEMYQGEDGKPMDVLFNPSGVLGRANPGAYLEAAAGKIAEKTGKTYLVNNFGTKDARAELQDELASHGINRNNAERLYDPTTNKHHDRVNTGNLHFVKLRHQVSKKLSARGHTTYTHDDSPAREPHASPMAIGMMEMYSLLSSGGTAFLRDAATIKSQRNDEFWRAIQLGLPTPPPKSPFVVDKFMSYMKGAGINVKQDGKKLKALPLTDADIIDQSNGAITSPGVVRANDLAPEPKGLFDRGLTGGFDGNYWNHIDLEGPIANPLMDQAIIGVLSRPGKPFKRAEFNGLINGTLWVTPDGELSHEHTKENVSGGEGLKRLLAKIDVNAELQTLRSQVGLLKGDRRDVAIKKMRYLRALKAINLTPTQAYLNSKVPVVPAKMRPIYPNPDGTLNVADPVHGYREVLMVNNQIKDLKGLGVDDKNLAPLRAQLYGAVRGLVGLQEPLTRSQNFKGFLATIKGQQNKYGLFQGRVLKRRQDLSGRSTIIPDPKLGIDEAKLPEEMAFTIYKPFLVQRMGMLGYPPLKARELIEKRDPVARTALEAVVKERPVVLNRAPSLHKFSLLSFKPMLTKGKAIEINPLVVKGFNADFDGDAMQVHVPVSEDARREATTKLLPSNNLFSPRDNSLIHSPSMEMVLGIYLMTTPKGKAVQAATENQALQMYRSGRIKANQAVMVHGNKICPGQIIFNKVFPVGLKPGNVSVDKKALMKLLHNLARKKPSVAGQVISKVKDLGNEYVTEIGWSFDLGDLAFPKKERDAILTKAKKNARTMGFAKAYGAAADEMQRAVKKQVDNRLVIGGPLSGAFGKSNEITQMVASPVAVKDHEGNVTEVPIERSFSEGMDMGSFWALIPGSRRGLMDRTLSTADTGAFGKALIAATVDTTVSTRDCGTLQGIEMVITDPEALDRVVSSGRYRGKITDTQLIRNLKARGVKKIKVRSPLRCQATRGVCAMCFGPLENGQFPSVGYHVGTLAGQTISEPATQLTMKTFHTGGALGGASLGYPRLKQILEMPTNVKGRAILALQPGKVDGIETSAAGGWNVSVDGLRHFVPKEVGLGVKKRQKVFAGQMLSAGGAVKPQDLLAATNDIKAVQTQMITDMSKVFTDAGVRVKRKIFETAIHPLTTRAQVDDPGDADMEFGVHRGDVMSVNNIEAMNKKLKRKRKQLIEFTPTLLSIRKAPQYANDFIGQLVAERPHQTLKAAPGLGAVSNIGPDGHPIATYAFGKYFNTKVREDLSKTALTEEIDLIMDLMVEPEEIPTSDLDAGVSKVLEELAAQFEE
jgi:DNA-directed RNA polymerase subunit beta'